MAIIKKINLKDLLLMTHSLAIFFFVNDSEIPSSNDIELFEVDRFIRDAVVGVVVQNDV